MTVVGVIALHPAPFTLPPSGTFGGYCAGTFGGYCAGTMSFLAATLSIMRIAESLSLWTSELRRDFPKFETSVY